MPATRAGCSGRWPRPERRSDQPSPPAPIAGTRATWTPISRRGPSSSSPTPRPAWPGPCSPTSAAGSPRCSTGRRLNCPAGPVRRTRCSRPASTDCTRGWPRCWPRPTGGDDHRRGQSGRLSRWPLPPATGFAWPVEAPANPPRGPVDVAHAVARGRPRTGRRAGVRRRTGRGGRRPGCGRRSLPPGHRRVHQRGQAVGGRSDRMRSARGRLRAVVVPGRALHGRFAGPDGRPRRAVPRACPTTLPRPPPCSRSPRADRRSRPPTTSSAIGTTRPRGADGW